ncbi:hypothetical protein CK203_105173 [Vitis vinifera]|uniref:Uncharacterized protein n=1 Tax=Vitis vinifera TaxID=29760 RepID=A0A438CFU1_VITVI|nr:hypothetical protein CK203_105173 [Vitis vinifera]
MSTRRSKTRRYFEPCTGALFFTASVVQVVTRVSCWMENHCAFAMSLVTDSRVHSPSSDGFAAYLDAELDSDSSDVSPEQEAEDDEQEAEDESDSEYKRVKRQKVEEFESIEEHPGSTSDGSLEQNLAMVAHKYVEP